MYKDDNITGSCNEAILRRILEGRANSPQCDDCESPDMHDSHSHVCGGISWGLSGYPLASVYAPIQSFEELYDTESALKHGTLFKELDLPFLGDKRIKKGGSCRG